jgi:3',5'-cyclic AMP phosphodiesterase CpdA
VHFGSPRQLQVWKSLRDYLNDTVKPQLVLVTGDVVHTPDEAEYRRAFDELSLLRVVGPNPPNAYFVCAGNHDRHPYGNAPGPLKKAWSRIAGWAGAPAWFDNNFVGRIPTVQNPQDITLRVNTNEWKIRIIGCDTSANAEYTALGYATADELGQLADAAKGNPDADLVILLHQSPNSSKTANDSMTCSSLQSC